jgi:hypothetical protein
VLSITPAGATQGQKIVFNTEFTANVGVGDSLTFGYAELVYNRLVQYIGEVNGVSNVQEANRSYTEVYAHIPDHTGRTPDILFRTMTDVNYKANMSFPVLPSQYQPEILGAEFFTSPIVSNPQNYPGSYYGQFDTPDYTYETSTGDAIRRTGDYFGVTGDINNPVIDPSGLDGINLDFNISHYVKMNIPRRVLTNFDQFNAQSTNNQPPKDFEFNAILWYYTVDNGSGITRTNLYGVSFLDNPDNNTTDGEVRLRFPTYKKLVSNGKQDGTSYAFSLNLNFNIINDNVQESYNPEAINSLFSMNLFNKAMSKLSSANDSLQNVISDNITIREEINNIKGLIYTQTDINTINSRINNLDNLLRLYSKIQIEDSNSIITRFLPGTPPTLLLESIEAHYSQILNLFTGNMFNSLGVIPVYVSVPFNKTFLVQLTNNDEVELAIPNNQKLAIYVQNELSLGQTMDLVINPSQLSTQNKKLDIFIQSDYAGSVTLTQVLLMGDINLPVSYNDVTETQNASYLWKKFDFNIDFNQDIHLLEDNKLSLSFDENPYIVNNSIKEGEVLQLNNFFVGTSSVYDFSGQYVVDSLVSSTSSQVIFDLSSNTNIISYGASQSLPLMIHSASASLLSNKPYFSLNKGKMISVTRVSDSSVLSERYLIKVNDIM